MFRKLRRAAAIALSALGLLVAIVSFTPLVKWWARAMIGPWPEPKGDILIVLGGDTLDANTLGLVSYWRSVYAVLVYRAGGFREVLVSGREVAPLIRDFLVCQGVPAAAIRVEEASNSTRENAVAAARLLASTPGRKVLLSGDMHIFRARRAFARAGLEVIPCPFPYGLKLATGIGNRWNVFLQLAGETAKIGYYWARGWL